MFTVKTKVRYVPWLHPLQEKQIKSYYNHLLCRRKTSDKFSCMIFYEKNKSIILHYITWKWKYKWTKSFLIKDILQQWTNRPKQQQQQKKNNKKYRRKLQSEERGRGSLGHCYSINLYVNNILLQDILFLVTQLPKKWPYISQKTKLYSALAFEYVSCNM